MNYQNENTIVTTYYIHKVDLVLCTKNTTVKHCTLLISKDTKDTKNKNATQAYYDMSPL